MTSLIYRDFVSMKKNFRYYAVAWTVMLLMPLMGDTFHGIAMAPVFIITIGCSSLFSLDELSGWNAYAVTLPEGRSKMVASRLASLYLLTGCGFVVSLLVLVVEWFAFMEPVQFWGEVAYALLLLLLTLLFQSVMTPVLYHFGLQRGRGFLLGMMVVILSIIKLLPSMREDWLQQMTMEKGLVLLAGGVALWLLSWAVSYRVTMKLIENKEF